MKNSHRRIRNQRPKHSLAKRRLLLELLETRKLLASIVVTSLADNLVVDGQLTLREAIVAANTNTSVDGSPVGEAGPITDEISFQSGLTGEITLDVGRLEITDDLLLNGPGQDVLTISGDQLFQIFYTSGPDNDIAITGLTLTEGYSAGNGGAIENLDANLTISHSTVSGSTAGDLGGGLSNYGNLNVADSTISGNATNNSYNGGGGVFNGSRVTISGSTILANSANVGAGLYNSGSAMLRDNTLSGNSAFSLGGGAFNLAQLSLLNSTVSGNSAGENGGGVNNWGSLSVAGTTIVANQGGGLFTALYLGSAPLLFNSIIAGNHTDSSAVDIDGLPVAILSAFNLIGDPLTAGGMTEGKNLVGNGSGDLLPLDLIVDPTLAANGGNTLTHALVSGSRAIDAGHNDVATTPGDDGIPGTGDANEVPLAFDQRGDPHQRIVDGTVDIGAIEFQLAVEVVDIGLSVAVDDANPMQDDEVELTITVTNHGSVNATTVVIENQVPAGLTFVSASSPEFNVTSGLWSVGELASGGTETLRITASVNTTDAVTNTARVDLVDPSDSNPANDQASVTISVNVPSGWLNVTGSGNPNPFQDGILIVRHMLGQPDANLEDPALIPDGATRTTGAAIRAHLEAAGNALDANGDGTVNPFQDGILIVRYLLGQPDANLEDPALIPAGSTRDTGAAIRGYLDTLVPAMPEREFLSGIQLLAGGGGEGEFDALMRTTLNPADVNGDGLVTVRDALNVINEVDRRRVDDEVWSRFDANRDRKVTAADALYVINRLADDAVVAQLGAAEGDSIDSVDRLFSDAALGGGLF